MKTILTASLPSTSKGHSCLSAPFFIICGHGQISLDDARTECQSANIAPLLVVRTQTEAILPCFGSAKLARKFVRWNLPPDWVWGVVNLRAGDLAELVAKGLMPRQYAEVPHFKTRAVFDVEVLEFSQDVEVIVR